MSSLTEFFNIQPNENLKGITHKNNTIKRNIIAYMALNGECTLSELTKELHISVPTITKLVQELIEEKIVNDLGKVETPGGRRPNVSGQFGHLLCWYQHRPRQYDLCYHRPAKQHR